MATFGDLKAYVDRAEGWVLEPNRARRRSKVGDHWRYRKVTRDGRTLSTKVSHSVREEIGPSLFRHILRDQLEVTEDAFWAVVRGRPEIAAALAPAPVPIAGWLVERLIFTVGMAEEEVGGLTQEEALAAWQEYRLRERP